MRCGGPLKRYMEICDLYAYKNGSSFKIDDDISALLFDVPDNFGFFD